MRNTAAGIQSEIAKGAFRPRTVYTNVCSVVYVCILPYVPYMSIVY